MTGAVRVKLTPEPSADLTEVSGVLIELEHFGGTSPSLVSSSSTDAQFVFLGAYLEKARGVSDPEFLEFARYSGRIELADGGPVWRCDPEAEVVYSGADGRDPEVIRRVRLHFGPQFVDPPELPNPAGELRFPVEPEGSRFFELAVELRVGSGVEAAAKVNDRLDVPLNPLRQRLVIEWPEEYTARVPSGLTLTVKAGSATRSMLWEQGEVVGDMRRFVFSKIPLESVSFTVGLDDDIMDVWVEQDLTDPEREPDWLGWLEEFLDDVGLEDEEADEVDQREHQSAEIDGRLRTDGITPIEV